MTNPFVWFHHNGKKAREAASFLTALLDVQASPGPAMTFLSAGGAPFAAVGDGSERYGTKDEWIPFVAVPDVDAATARAVSLGATLVAEKRRGPAGEFSVVRDPGGAALALWKKAP